MEKDCSDEETNQTERVSLAALKHRGKKKAIAPVIRTGPALKGTHVNLLWNALLNLPVLQHFLLLCLLTGWQVFLEACSRTVSLSSTKFPTVGWWFLTRTKLKVLVHQSPGWNLGRFLPHPGQRRMNQSSKNGATLRYEKTQSYFFTVITCAAVCLKWLIFLINI